jgi:hypothetical protein
MKKSKQIEEIVTFCCSKSVHVYSKNCGVKPMPPYKSHASIDEAKKYLVERNKSNYEVNVIFS